jgi:hypothetical protein
MQESDGKENEERNTHSLDAARDVWEVLKRGVE